MTFGTAPAIKSAPLMCRGGGCRVNVWGNPRSNKHQKLNMEVQLPASQRDAFATFVGLDAAHLEKLGQFLRTLPLTFDYKALGERDAKEIDIDASRLTQILQMFTTMSRTCDNMGWSIEEFSESIFRTAIALGNPKLVPSNETAPQCQAILFEVLSKGSPLWRISKGLTVIADNAHLLEGVKIITELRPVFTSGEEVALEASAVTHSMSITYRDSEGVKDFYVIADASDLDLLQKALDRARRKEAVLREFIGTRLPFISSKL